MIPIDQILDRAADRVANGWCRGQRFLWPAKEAEFLQFMWFIPHDLLGGFPVAECAGQAIATEIGYGGKDSTEKDRENFYAVINFVETSIGVNLFTYNDAKGRRVYEVEQMLRDCADAWREQETIATSADSK